MINTALHEGIKQEMQRRRNAQDPETARLVEYFVMRRKDFWKMIHHFLVQVYYGTRHEALTIERLDLVRADLFVQACGQWEEDQRKFHISFYFETLVNKRRCNAAR